MAPVSSVSVHQLKAGLSASKQQVVLGAQTWGELSAVDPLSGRRTLVLTFPAVRSEVFPIFREVPSAAAEKGALLCAQRQTSSPGRIATRVVGGQRLPAS